MARLTKEQIAAIREAVQELSGSHFRSELPEHAAMVLILNHAEALLADLEEARAALRAIEWIQPEALLHYQSYCPECGNYQTTGHKSDCAIGKALAATEEKTNEPL